MAVIVSVIKHEDDCLMAFRFRRFPVAWDFGTLLHARVPLDGDQGQLDKHWHQHLLYISLRRQVWVGSRVGAGARLQRYDD